MINVSDTGGAELVVIGLLCNLIPGAAKKFCEYNPIFCDLIENYFEYPTEAALPMSFKTFLPPPPPPIPHNGT